MSLLRRNVPKLGAKSMANPEHEARLRTNRAEWNSWREGYHHRPDLECGTFEDLDLSGYNLSHTKLRGAVFRRCKLSGAMFESADLKKTSFSEIKCTVRADFSRAVMNSTTMTICQWQNTKFDDAKLKAGAFEECKFVNDCTFPRVDLNGAHFRDCTFEKCAFNGADLTRVVFEIGPSLAAEQANRVNCCIFTDASLAAADMRGAVGYQFDHNNIQGTLIAPHALDDWSILRRTYTGTRLIFNLIFLACFFAPIVAKTLLGQ
jgi:uncharacterized protein YjbI with pentapeptide repeats